MHTSSRRKSSISRFIVLLLAAFLGAAGCSSTKITGVWKDDTYQPRGIRNVLVIAAAKTPTVRRFGEGEFARLLRRHGVNAVESFTLFPEDAMDSTTARDAIAAKIKELGIDAVLMTRSIGTRTEKETVPGINVSVSAPYASYGAWNSYHTMAYTIPVAGPASPPSVSGVSHERSYILMETALYDSGTEKLIWSARSETLVSRIPEEEIKPYIGLVVDRLLGARLF